MNERASQLALVDNVPTVRPGSDGHTYQDRTGGTEASAFYIDDKIDVGNWTITPGIRFEKIDSDWRDRPVLGLNGKPVQGEAQQGLQRTAAGAEPDVSRATSGSCSPTTPNRSAACSISSSARAAAATIPPPAWSRRRPRPTNWARATTTAAGAADHAVLIDFDDELQYVSNDVGWTNLGATKHQGHRDFRPL